jgi:tetratricopeptide (TPR) repeat protein
LVDASTDTTQWREGYERPLKDVLALQSEIALAIAREIDVVVTPEEQRRLAQTRVVDPAAYDAYLKGQFHWAKFTPPDLELALEYFEQAARREPALGHAGIALVWTARRQMGLAEPHESGRLAKEAAEKALEADETLAETHYAVAISGAWIDWDLERAQSELRRALEIRPGFAEAHAYLSHLLICVNRPDEALAEMNKALEIDPNNELFRSLSGIVLVAARRFDEAIRLFRKAKKTSPGSPVINRGLHSAFHMKGMFEEALAESRFRRTRTRWPPWNEATLATVTRVRCMRPLKSSRGSRGSTTYHRSISRGTTPVRAGRTKCWTCWTLLLTSEMPTCHTSDGRRHTSIWFVTNPGFETFSGD